MERSVKNVNENWMYSKLSEEWRRQSLWGYRIFDFWNHKIGCAVEVDGEEHDRDYDNYRDEYNYRRSGIVVLRVRNRNEADADEVLSTISRLGDHRERKTAMGIMGNRKQKSSLAEKPYDKNNLMFLGFMKSIGHTPYWDTSP